MSCYFSKGKEQSPVRIDLPADIFDSITSDEESEVEQEDMEAQYKFGKIRKDPTDECLKRALELYDNYHNMSDEEWVLSLFLNIKVLDVLIYDYFTTHLDHSLIYNINW